MLYKSTVILEKTKKEMYFASGVVESEFKRIGYDAIITSGQDSHDSRPASLHHTGDALDYRLKHLPVVTRAVTVSNIRKVLKPLGFDVLHEGSGTNNEHMHIEFDPKDNQIIFRKMEV